MNSDRKKQDAPQPDGEQTESGRQQEVSVWARAFGVSSDDQDRVDDGTREAREQVREAEAERARRGR